MYGSFGLYSTYLQPVMLIPDAQPSSEAFMIGPQVIGSHQLSPEAKDKAAKRRAKQAAEERKSTAGEREQAQQLKRQEKKQEELVYCS